MLSAEDIKAYAMGVGFSYAGVARAEALETEIVHFNEWCARGFDATMGWMSKRREERTDVRCVLPGARSVIVVALNYAAPLNHKCGPDGLQISKYARGRDYHTVIGARLEEMMKWIRAHEPGAEGRYYVDTGPVLEKAWAVRAGVGWLGKHTNIITKRHGSFLFLGVLITTLELTPDAPAVDQCGKCTRCIDACPTQAIAAPYLLDARRCISYLTIEHRGELPEEFAKGCGDWVFGCDICQDVCPWNNKFSQPSEDLAWTDESGINKISPDGLLSLTKEQFGVIFRHSAIRRARWEGFVRNVRNALKNVTGRGSDPSACL
jgi:epoxyqueuosine reductase